MGADSVTPKRQWDLGHLGESLARFDKGAPYSQCQPKPVGALCSGEQGADF